MLDASDYQAALSGYGNPNFRRTDAKQRQLSELAARFIG